MSQRKEPAIPNDLLDQLLAGSDVSAAFDQQGLLDFLKKALTEWALNAEMDHHLGDVEQTGNIRNGYTQQNGKMVGAFFLEGPALLSSQEPPLCR